MQAPLHVEKARQLHDDPVDSFTEPEPRSNGVIDFLLLLSLRKRTAAVLTLSGALVGLVFALLMKPTYTATATIMPPQAPQSSLSSMLGQLGSLSSLGGASNLLKNPSDLYVGMLESRTLSDRAISHFQLQDRWHAKTKVDARKKLSAHVQFEAAKDGLIAITVNEHDPKLASDLANFFVDGLYTINADLAVSEAGQRRLFFEKQIDEEKKALAAAEDELKATQQKTGMIALNGQAELAVQNIAQTRAQISARQVELQGMLSYSAPDNPNVLRIRQEIGTLQAQLAELENKQNRALPGDPEIGASQVPASSLEYLRKLRAVKYHDTLFDLLSRQYEAARIDEAKSAPILQVLDRAVPPDQKSGPPRLLIVIGSALLGFCGACAYIFLQAVLHRMEGHHGLAQLRVNFPWL